MQAVIFTFREFEFPLKKLFACVVSLDKVVGIFEKFSKKRGGTSRERVCLGAKTLAAQFESCHKEKNTVGYKFGTQRLVNIGK
jgi:hypothetical protein